MISEYADGTLAPREAVRNEPDNVKVRGFLFAAYREKIVLLDDLLEMSRAAFPGVGPARPCEYHEHPRRWNRKKPVPV